MEIFSLEIRLKGISPHECQFHMFRNSNPRVQLGIPCTAMPVKSLDALERIIKSHSVTTHCDNATPLYKWHPYLYSKEAFYLQARMTFHIPNVHFILM